MDSRLASDPTARYVVEVLSNLENAAGVRAHYRLLETPPLTATDQVSLQMTARVIADWIGLRNAIFHLSVKDTQQPPLVQRSDRDHEEFLLELPQSAVQTPEDALGCLCRAVSIVYLQTSNIGGSSSEPEKAVGGLADITAVFLGLGKLLLNSPASPGARPAHASTYVDSRSAPQLSLKYLAFAQRMVCAMRGLDWNQHTSGITKEALEMLRAWDTYRDSVFSHSLRNVLTASASHKPLTEAIEDNHLALARLDLLTRFMRESITAPLQGELAAYHSECRAGRERLAAREADTYDPCLVYLNQVRRRMDLQRYADLLELQRDAIIQKLETLRGAINELATRGLVQADAAQLNLDMTLCPQDGTPIPLPPDAEDQKVRCPTCEYQFLASAGGPLITMFGNGADSRAPDLASPEVPRTATEDLQKAARTKSAPAETLEADLKPMRRSNKSATALVLGLILLPLAWVPLISFVVWRMIEPGDMGPTENLGTIGIIGSGIGCLVVLFALLGLVKRWSTRKGERLRP